MALLSCILPINIYAQNDSSSLQNDSDSLAAITVKPIPPLVKNLDRPFQAENGLEGRHIAMWGSHGLYYELANARWEWQRARMFQTIEDKFPSSFVIPYIAPMLENAGAVVMMPRERDTNPYEVIVDNDKHLASSPYHEHNGHFAWKDGEGYGFAYKREIYKDFENPFTEGTYRETTSVTDDEHQSTVTWTPSIPEERRYAVYISYKSFANSAEDVKYTVHHKGGTTTFSVNQTMGGGTWIYLGTFSFEKGQKGKVVLTNLSKDADRIITADAVKFGGGMGNIARAADGTKIYDNTKKKKGNSKVHSRESFQPVIPIQYETSGYPRYTEGSRYYLQWAGMPKSVYSMSDGTNDYTDDYKSRSAWVNYLAGGSKAWPSGEGLNIPIDLSFAFHTDAGTKNEEKLVGTLAIYQTKEYGGKLGDGSSRSACRELTTTIYNSIMNDIQKQIEPRWPGRNCVDKDYNEASQPRVPAMLLELMSHENFADMRYGLDPRFRFIVSRAIYKGMLRFLSKRNGFEYVVQPLPVDHFSATFAEGNKVLLRWKAVADSLESTAVAEKYVLYKRIGNGDFDNGTIVEQDSILCDIPQGEVVSFKVTALNRGGQSMPSEILSVGINPHSTDKPILVINGFDRISAPDEFMAGDDKQAGFLADEDNGVSDGEMLNYVGKMKEFRRSIPWTDDDSPGYGASLSNYEKFAIAGNTFDYPALHGRSIMKAGYSFVSISRSAVADLLPLATDSLQTLNNSYSAIDLILGKQKQSKFGRKAANPIAFKTFDSNMQQLLTAYCTAGGPVFVSGSYVATDIWQNRIVSSNESDKKFAQNILKYKFRDEKAAVEGKINYIPSPLASSTQGAKQFEYFNTPNGQSYAVESPDAIIPADPAAYTAFRYSENGLSAGIVFGGNAKDKWRTVVLGFPFESVKSSDVRDKMMKEVLIYLKGVR